MHDVSIVLLTYNGEKYLRQVLEMIGRQKLQPREIIAIDSGSTDATLQILRESQAALYEIPNSEFSHPKTRNMAVRMALGKYVVFLTQDATPADNCWLEQLLQPFETMANVAGTFSRQTPRPGGDLLEANDVTLYFPGVSKRKTMPQDPSSYPKQIWDLIQFSNASSACIRDLLLHNPFDERLEMAEDQEWAKRMLEQRFTIVYAPDSVVLHSHQHTLREKQQRSYLMGSSFSKFLSPILGRRRFPLIAWAVHLFLDSRFLLFAKAPLGSRLKWLCLSPWHRAAIHYAYWRGWNAKQALRKSEAYVHT